MLSTGASFILTVERKNLGVVEYRILLQNFRICHFANSWVKKSNNYFFIVSVQNVGMEGNSTLIPIKDRFFFYELRSSTLFETARFKISTHSKQTFGCTTLVSIWILLVHKQTLWHVAASANNIKINVNISNSPLHTLL